MERFLEKNTIASSLTEEISANHAINQPKKTFIKRNLNTFLNILMKP